MAKFLMAEIRDIDDPSRVGSCKVRIYNRQNDEQQTTDENLKWAVPCHPLTSAATAGVGVTPQLVVGSRVLITFLEEDTEEQYPIMIASLPRGDKPTRTGVRKEPDEDSGGKINKPGFDAVLDPETSVA